IFQRLALKVCDRLVGCRRPGMLTQRYQPETRPAVEKLADEDEVVRDIRGDVQPAAGAQDALTVGRELRRPNAPLLMPLFPPRVREVYMDGLDGDRRDRLVEEAAGVGARNSDVLQIAFGGARCDVKLQAAQDFDAEVVRFGMGLAGGDDESPFAGTNLN